MSTLFALSPWLIIVVVVMFVSFAVAVPLTVLALRGPRDERSSDQVLREAMALVGGAFVFLISKERHPRAGSTARGAEHRPPQPPTGGTGEAEQRGEIGAQRITLVVERERADEGHLAEETE
jgi:hypothetical protein